MFRIAYMWLNYIHAQAFLTPSGFERGSTDFSLNGPYIGVKWLG